MLGQSPNRPQPFPQGQALQGQPSLGHRTLWAVKGCQRQEGFGCCCPVPTGPKPRLCKLHRQLIGTHCPLPRGVFSEIYCVFPQPEANSLHLQKQDEIHSPAHWGAPCLVDTVPPRLLSPKDILSGGSLRDTALTAACVRDTALPRRHRTGRSATARTSSLNPSLGLAPGGAALTHSPGGPMSRTKSCVPWGVRVTDWKLPACPNAVSKQHSTESSQPPSSASPGLGPLLGRSPTPAAFPSSPDPPPRKPPDSTPRLG